MIESDLSELSSSGDGSVLLASGESRSSKERVVLTSRDYQVLRYVLEMKFASTEMLFERYFKTTESGATATSPEFMRRRLLALEKNGLLRRWKNAHCAGHQYLATMKTRKLLQDRNPAAYYPRPQLGISFNSFRHDQLVQECRLEFERSMKLKGWIAEQTLRSTLMRDFQITPRFCPDGVYELPTNELIAFELEIAVKDSVRYREKMHKLASYINSYRHDPRMFQRVHFRCVTKQVYRLIERDSNIWPSIFKVELCEELIHHLPFSR